MAPGCRECGLADSAVCARQRVPDLHVQHEAVPVIKGSDGVWLQADDSTQIDEAIRVLRRTPPENGTNMRAAYRVVSQLSPRPDNVILLADGLPTMDGPTPDGPQPVDRSAITITIGPYANCRPAFRSMFFCTRLRVTTRLRSFTGFLRTGRAAHSSVSVVTGRRVEEQLQ